MARRAFVKVEYPDLALDLPNELLGVLVRLKWHMLEFYFLGVNVGTDGVNPDDLDPVPVNSRALTAITQRKKRDAQEMTLSSLGKLVGFTIQMDGDTALVSWAKWWEAQGLAPTRRVLKRHLERGSGTGAERNGSRTGERAERSGAERPPERSHGAERDRPTRPPAASGIGEEGPYGIGSQDRLQIEKWIVTQRPDLGRNGALGRAWEEWAAECAEKSFEPDNPAAHFTAWLKDH